MNANDRAITALVMVAHGAVHVYEMVIPLFVVSWLADFETIPLGIASVDVTTVTLGVVVTVGYVFFGVGRCPAASSSTGSAPDSSLPRACSGWARRTCCSASRRT